MRNQIRPRGGRRLAKRRRPMLGVVLVVALSSLALLSFSFPAEGENYQGVQKGVQQSAQAALPSPGWEITLIQAEPSSGQEMAQAAEGEAEALVLWTEAELELIAQTVWAEARGVESRAEQAAVVWCILNRVDAGTWGDTISQVVTYPSQFAWDPASPVEAEFVELAEDVCRRWAAEKAGASDVGRTLPAGYLYFEGDGERNHFRTEWEKDQGRTWDWSLPDPYQEG